MTSPNYLPGSDQFYVASMQKREEAKSSSPGFRLIEKANQVSVFNVLEDFFDLYLPRDGESYKSPCPFGSEHEDGGMDKGWRTYPATNSSFCFPMHGYLPPVRLVSIKFAERPIKSAERILRKYDLLRPKGYTHRMRELFAEAERSENEKEIGNPQHAVEALNLAISQIPNYTVRQFDSDVMLVMERVLGALDAVLQQGNPDLLKEWYIKAKSAMTTVVERERVN